jgi:hypothetical protein
METLLRINTVDESERPDKDEKLNNAFPDLNSRFIIFISDLGCLDVTSANASVVEHQHS